MDTFPILPIDISPPASQEEYVSRVQQWQQVLASPQVQQAMEKMAQMQGLGMFAGRLATNLGQGHSPLASFGNAVEAGAYAKNQALSSALQRSMDIARAQQEEDKFRYQRQQDEVKNKLAERELDIKERYYNRPVSGGGGASPQPEFPLEKRMEMWNAALENCMGDVQCARKTLAAQLIGVMDKETAMALFPQLRPSGEEEKEEPKKPEEPGFFSRVSGAVKEALRREPKQEEPPQPPQSVFIEPKQEPAKTVPPLHLFDRGPEGLIPMLRVPRSPPGSLAEYLDKVERGEERLRVISLQEFTDMQRRGLATPEDLKRYRDLWQKETSRK